MTNKMTTKKQEKKMAKPVKFWAVIDHRNVINRFWISPIKPNMESMLENERIARVEIREVEK